MGQFFQVFVLLWPIILLLSHTWPVLGPYLICVHIFLPRWIPAQRPRGDWQHILWGSTPSFSNLWRAFLHVSSWEVSFTSGVTDVVILSLYTSRAQLLPLTLSLECPGKTKLQFILLDELQLLSPGAHLPPMSPEPILLCPFYLLNLKQPCPFLYSLNSTLFLWLWPVQVFPSLNPYFRAAGTTGILIERLSLLLTTDPILKRVFFKQMFKLHQFQNSIKQRIGDI